MFIHQGNSKYKWTLLVHLYFSLQCIKRSYKLFMSSIYRISERNFTPGDYPPEKIWTNPYTFLKIAVLVFQCLTGLFIWLTTASSPLIPVLADSAQPTQRSALSVARATTSATGALQRPDHVCGTRIIPLNLRLCDSLGQFKRSLKTFLFGLWDHGALWHQL